MKRSKKKVIAVVLSLVLALSLSSSVLAADTSSMGDTITGDSTVTNPVFNFEVPSTADFAFNAFEVGDANSQITSPEYFVINKSSIPVQVSFDFSLTTDPGVTVVNNPSDVDTSGSVKEMYMKAVPAKTVVAEATGSALVTTGSAIVWGASGAALSTTASPAAISYVLSAADFNVGADNVAQSNEFDKVDGSKSVAAFRFKGTINPDVTWSAGDATASVVYSIKGVTATAYSAFSELTDLQNVKSISDAVTAQPKAPSVTTLSKTVTLGATQVAYTVDLGSGDLAATGIPKVVWVNGSALAALTSAEFSFDAEKKTLTLTKSGSVMNTLLGAKGTYTLRVDFNDGASTKINDVKLIVQ